LQDAGHLVTGARRRVAQLPAWLTAVQADVLKPESLSFLSPADGEPFDVVIYTLAAAGFDEQSYRDAYVTGVQNTLHALRNAMPSCFLFVSSTGVYHQNDGSVVDELSPVEPTRFNGRLVLQGEQLVQASGVGTCVRFSGIYGPDRLRLINRIASGQATLDESPPYTNRIHIEDCAAVLAHLVELSGRDEPLASIYLASDCEPATSADVESYIAGLLGLSLDDAAPVARSKRLAGSKRCSNQRLLDSGFRFRYPDYKSGYRQVVDSVKSSGTRS
jgi:nucleoside-diphosphate-sugar epimerase